MGSRSKPKKRGSTVVGRRWKYDRKKRRASRLRFTDVLEHVLGPGKIFKLDTSADAPAEEVQRANFRAERPALFASRHVLDRQAAAVLAKPRAKTTQRPRIERRKTARAAAKAARRTA